MSFHTPKGRGKFLRQAINKAIRENFISYTQVENKDISLEDNRWKATIEYYDDNDVYETEDVRFINRIVQFSIYFTPDTIEYAGCPVYYEGYHWYVDWKTYRWAIFKLSEHQIMQKMSE